MHIPDGFLDAKTWMSLTAVSAIGIRMALRKTQADPLFPSRIPQIGMISAFIFASQMINFPVAGATSGHLDGATLAAVLFGPWISMLVMTTVVTIQCLLFQDGGVTALGANIFNMGIVAALCGYGVAALSSRSRRRWVKLSGIFAGSWLAVQAAAAAASLELAVSGTVPLAVALKAMLSWHALIGIGEAIITTGVCLYFMERESLTKPGTLPAERSV